MCLVCYSQVAESLVKLDFQLTFPVIGLLICCLIFPFLPHMHLSLMDGMLVTTVEALQALMLLSFAIFSFFYIRPYPLSQGQKWFWLWSIAWWILLFGRSTSWGRDYFPEVPKVYFRGISVILIATVVFMLFAAPLRQEILYKFKQVALSFWAIALVLLGLIISDAIEHNRALSVLLFNDLAYKDLMEECFEFPLIVGLFLIAFPLMKKDCKMAQLEAKIVLQNSMDLEHSAPEPSVNLQR